MPTFPGEWLPIVTAFGGRVAFYSTSVEVGAEEAMVQNTHANYDQLRIA